MKDTCVFKPTVKNNEISKLYDELLTFTKLDRLLTNLLYAISLLDRVKKSFSPSDFNRQGEIDSSALIKRFNVTKMLSDKALIEAMAKSIGAIDTSGNVIEYDDIDTIVDRVIAFNDTNDDFKATIKFNPNKKFVILVDITNADNFYTNNSLEYRKTAFGTMLGYLNTLGFNTDLSLETKTFFNLLNSFYSVDTIKGLSKATLTDPLSLNKAHLILDLCSTLPNVQRFMSYYGDDAADALVYISGGITSYDPTGDPNFSYWRGKGFLVLLDAQNMFHRIDTVALTTQIDSATAGLSSYTFKGLNNKDIKDTLDELYEDMPFLDANILSSTDKKINSVSKAARELLRLKNKAFELSRIKQGTITSENYDYIKSIEKQVELGKYMVSIARLLLDFQDDIKQMNMEWASVQALFEATKDSPDPKLLGRMSTILLSQYKRYTAYLDVVYKLTKMSSINNDDILSEPILIKQIETAATSIYTEITQTLDGIRDKEFDVVYAALKPVWGDDKASAGKEYNLALLLLTHAESDINFVEHLLLPYTESTDPVIATVGEMFRLAKDNRDARVADIQRRIRIATEKLYKTSNSQFMYLKDAKGVPTGRLLSPYDYDKYNEEKEKFVAETKAKKLSKDDERKLIRKWVYDHTLTVKPFADLDYDIVVPIYAKADWDSNLTEAQKDYYNEMMHIKAEYQMLSGVYANRLYDAVLISSTFAEAVSELKNIGLFKALKNKFKEGQKAMEDDTDYGYVSLLKSGLLAKEITDFDGSVVKQIPLFFTHEIENKERLSTDFSRSLLAFTQSIINYDEMRKIEDTMLLTKEYLMKREIKQTRAGAVLGDVFGIGRNKNFDVVTKSTAESKTGEHLDWMYERALYGIRKKDDLYLFDNKVAASKITDALTTFTSINRLSVNILGALANLLVGKIQMWIDSGLGLGGEFFNMKELSKAHVEYGKMILPLLQEMNSNTKHSKLALLNEKFDVMQEWYQKLKESGFYKTNFGKIIGNTNLMFLYGMGEHMIRTETMLACLLHIKVKDKNGNTKTLLDAFDVKRTGNTGELYIKDGYTYNGLPITEDFILFMKKRISYTNKSLHGAYNAEDKGFLHRYALGRLILNFRQWMPAHYSRRFNKRYYDAELQEFREGYYNTAYKFIKDCVKDLRNKKLDIGTRWNEMDDMEKYNLKRAIAEVTLLSIISAAIQILPDEKDKKGNWAYRNMVYQLKRMEMETMASSPVWIPWSDLSPFSFVNNAVKTLNSPVAAFSTIEDITTLLDFTTAFETIESGKHKGENRYLYNLERKVPLYGGVKKQIEMKDSNDMFNIFNK